LGIGSKRGPEGHAITAEFQNHFVVSYYAPSSGIRLEKLEARVQWDVNFLEYLKELMKQKPVIVCGDFNVAHLDIDLSHPQQNKNRAPCFSDQERIGFSNILESGFSDCFRHFNLNTKDAYTYWKNFQNSRGRNIGWRLDYILVSNNLKEKIKETYMRTNVIGSDHCPIVLHIETL